jgi:hypothetical protein
MAPLELLRTWEVDPFRLELYLNGTNWGRVRLAYQLYDGCELIFSGDDFYPSPAHVYDGDEAVAGLLGFLALKPGDTDREYLDAYTQRQLDWVADRAEALALAALELEP